MEKLISILCLGLFIFSGCSTQYSMKLTNGMKIITASKPKLKGATYYFKDAKGEVNTIPQSRVLEIEPASMAEEENKFTPAKPEKSHWWKFW